jgi:hypothetical protein
VKSPVKTEAGIQTQHSYERRSQECNEFVHVQTGLANDGAQRPTVKLFVIGYGHLTKRLRSPEDHVIALLTLEDKAGLEQG